MMAISIWRVLAKFLSYSRDCVHDKPIEKLESSETLKSATDYGDIWHRSFSHFLELIYSCSQEKRGVKVISKIL